MIAFNIDVAKDGFTVTHNTEDGPIQAWEEYFFIVATSPRGEDEEIFLQAWIGPSSVLWVTVKPSLGDINIERNWSRLLV